VLWSTAGGDVPFDVRASGEVMSVSAVGVPVFDSFTRSVSSGWGTTSTGAQAWTTSGGSASDYNVSGTEGTMSLGSVNVFRQAILSSLSYVHVDHQINAKLGAGVFPTGNNVVVQLTGRRIDGNNMYRAQMLFIPGPSISVRLVKTVGGSTTTLTTVAIPRLTYGSNTYFTLRMAVVGSTIAAKVWMSSGSEPAYWDVTWVDTDLTAAGAAAVAAELSTGNTNVTPVTVTFDAYTINNPQVFTVTRSVNGVTKAQTAGTAVELADPANYGL
jgi:hypothetical protein